MTIDVRSSTGTLAALLSGILAAVALTSPARMRWPVTEPQSKIDQWISSQSTSVVVGAIVAVAACAYLQHRGSRRRAWAFVNVGVVVLILIRFLVPEELGLDLLSVLGFAKTIAAGLILGGAVAASWDSRIGRNLLIVGVVSTWLAAQSSTGVLIPVSTSSIGEPAWALLWLTLICAVACAITVDSESRIGESEPVVSAAALAVVTGLAVTQRILNSVVDRQDSPSTYSGWVVMVASTVAVLTLTWFCTRRLDTTSDSGGFLWAATAVAAAATTVFADLTDRFFLDGDRTSPLVIAALAIIAVVVGLTRSRHRNRRIVGLALLAAIPLSEWIFSADQEFALLLRIVMLGVGSGLLFGSVLPSNPVIGALGLTIPFTALVFMSIGQHDIETVSSTYVQHDSELRDFTYPSGPDTAWQADVSFVIVDATEEPPRSVGTALLMCVVVVATGIALRRRNSVDTPTPD
ncbi:hypothetical protein QM716_28225 [Rhodococcus sp. IEGM 1409]|uniref:hypothetical protein n=1 Tax=Rhodococcus sp. IEGM 1409 TaxID=3047082 RepID=UPI0024B858FA|nr:hypothetical protein [Rhodococcus sp. IEGM 1409]MDI9903757.1 hypothetical protein [Rhodococcus sp. IEGM 1409]